MSFGSQRMSVEFGKSTDSVTKIKLKESPPKSQGGGRGSLGDNTIKILYSEKDNMSIKSKQGFTLKGVTWTTLERYLIAMKLQRETDREAVRLSTASELEENRSLWLNLPSQPDWERSRDGIALHALRHLSTYNKTISAFVSNPENVKKHIIYEYPHSAYWGTGQPSEDGLNRLGSLLSQIIQENSMPSYVPRELYDDPLTFGSEYNVDIFVSRLSHRLLERRSSDMRPDFEKLFKCAGELLKSRKSRAIENLSIKSSNLREAKELFDAELHASDGALQVLNAAKENIDDLQTALSTVVNATAATGKRLSVIDKQISRAVEARLLIEQFNCFDALEKTDHVNFTTWLSDLRKHQRSVQELIRSAIIKKTDNSYEDDTEPVEILKDKIRVFPLPSVFQLGVYSSGLSSYSEERKCVEATKRLKGLVSEWSSKRLGIVNVTSYESFLTNTLVEDLVGMQNQLHFYLNDGTLTVDCEQSETLFYNPMRKVEQLLSFLGYPQAATRSYRGNIEAYKINIQESEPTPTHDSDDEDNISVPRSIESALSGIVKLLRTEAPIVRKVFSSPESVINSILLSTIEQLNIPELVRQSLEAYSIRASDARKVQDYFLSGGVDQMFEPDGVLAKRLPEMPPRSPRSQRFYEYASQLPIDNSGKLNNCIKNDLAAFSRTLSTINKRCIEFVKTATEIAPECEDSVHHIFDSIFSEPRKAFESYEPMCLEAFYSSQSRSSSQSLTVFVRLGEHACKESISRAILLCTEQHQQAMAKDLCCTFLSHTCKKISSVVAKASGPVSDELKRPVDKQEQVSSVHIAVLESVCEAVTAIEMMDHSIDNQFKTVLSVSGLQAVSSMRQKSLETLEMQLGGAVGSAIGVVASRGLGTLLKQKKNDFSKKDALYTSNATPACAECTSYLREQFEEISNALRASPMTLQSATELLLHLLLKGLFAHVKSFTVTTEGAFQLKRDCTEYKNVAATLGVNQTQQFELLLEICNIPMVSAANLKLIISEGRLGELPQSELLDFVKMRADWKDIRKRNDLKRLFES